MIAGSSLGKCVLFIDSSKLDISIYLSLYISADYIYIYRYLHKAEKGKEQSLGVKRGVKLHTHSRKKFL